MSEGIKFTCSACGGTFNSCWSDEEALAELRATFDVPVTECVAVCDDCYKIMIGHAPGTGSGRR